MKIYMKWLLIAVLNLFLFSSQAQISFDKRGDEDGITMISTSKVQGKLVLNNQSTPAVGRFSMELKASEYDLKKGTVNVRMFNLAFFGVDQSVIAPLEKRKEKYGFYGLSLDTRKMQNLKINMKKGIISGELLLAIDADVLGAIHLKPEEEAGKGGDDLILTPTVPATCKVTIQFDRPIKDLNTEQINQIPSSIQLEITNKKMDLQKFVFPAGRLIVERPEAIIDIGIWRYFETAKSLCLQPVFFSRFSLIKTGPFGGIPTFIRTSTGKGLPFGEPQLRNEWKKADVVFNIKDPIHIYNQNHFIVSSNAEENQVLNLVNEDECIEIYFIEDFDPVDDHGGGATWGSGTATAKIISSDGNADGGVDFTHLAHEVGHVLGLRHPSDSPTTTAQPASSGTLLCPSGFLNDNPQVNSQENADRLSNPLLVPVFKLISPGPDCADSADCGSCP